MDTSQGKDSFKFFLDNEAFLVKKFNRNIDLFTVRGELESKKKINFVFAMKDGFIIEKEEEFDFTLNEISDEDKIYLKLVKNNEVDNISNTTTKDDNFNLIDSTSNNGSNLMKDQLIDKPPAAIPNNYNNNLPNNNFFQNKSINNNNQNKNNGIINQNNNFPKNENFSQNNRSQKNNFPLNNYFLNNNISKNISMIQNNNFSQNNNNHQNNNMLQNNNFSQNNNNHQNNNMLQNNNFSQYNNFPQKNNMLQNNNFSQYNYNHQNNNMLQNNNFLQNNNNSQNNNFPQRINIPQNNFPQSNNIPQNLKYSQNINMPQNNFSQSNNIQQNYNFPQNNFPQSNNIQRNYNFPQDNNHKGFNTRIFEKFNDLENEIKKINTNLGIVKNENGINHLNTQNSTIGITNAMKINIYINGNFKFTKFLEKDLLLEKIREEIYNEIKSDFLFLLPDGFIINKEEEKLFSLEVILNENKLYINTEDIIIKINENKNKQSSKTTNANNEQTNGSENFTKNNENKNKDNNADNDNENNNNNKNQFIFKKRNKIEKNGKNDENDKGSLNKLIQSCQKLDNIGDLEIYLYPKINFTSKEKKNSIILMVVGQTGSGKTTLLNAFLNFLLGVEYEDNFRFKLIHEDFGISMAESQTKDVTVYNIRPLNKDFPLITVIDTPGFGDTGGIEKDKLIADKIAEKFHSEISHINAICFVAQSTNSKLTINQKYIFNSIMDLFSDEIKENFIAMLTFCNIIDENPVILEPLKKKGSGFDLVLPAIENTQWYFLFDNLAVFKSKENKKLNNKIKSFYGFAMENFHEFMAKLQSLKKKRLYNTKKVLNDRKFLESRVKILEEIVKTCLNKIDEFMQTYNIIRNYYNELQNKNFIYTVTETKSRKVPISNYKGGGGPYFTTCLICSHTCHPGCHIDSNKKKKKCSAMDRLTGKCKVCKKNCDWSSHENRDYFWEEYQEKVQKTDEFLKEKYVKKESEKSAKEQILEGLEIDISKQNFDLINTQEEMKDTINELKKIALNKDVFESAEQHIDLLIENEKFEQKPGWQKRIEAFNILKRQKIKLKQIYHGKHTDANKIQDFVKTFNKKELQKNSGGKCSIF